MRFGSKCWLNADAIRIGKYGIGTKMIIRPTKLMSSRWDIRFHNPGLQHSRVSQFEERISFLPYLGLLCLQCF